ncbi:ABC transporter substrate-binding protein [Gordonia spumicola]|uniref:ABC transporter substrate-binding protein n=1 Tax=Gordonia spumicola TaxID=589161 RepID=A0A7I9VEW9_9ACTN|nr:ABC transporter substrate-binding protein [Gordonia spumicola]GEE03845.1 ABC transporter substrate-binding protein [Gordonia spumicola]
MRTRFTVGATLVAATALLSGCSSTNGDDPASGAISVENCGRTVTLAAPAKAAITLNQGATETALSIGAGDQMIGTAYLDDTIAPQWEQAYSKIPVLAKEFPDRETVISRKPDLLLASYGTAFDDKALGSQDELAKIGIASYVSPFSCADKAKRAPASWDAIARETSDNGVLFGRPSAADEVNAAMRTTVDGVKAAATGRGKKIFWFDSGTTTPYVGGGKGGPQLIIDAVGGTNVFAGIDGNWADGDWETVITADPDVIVLADAGWDTAQAKRAYLENDPVLKNLRAVKTGAFIVVPFSESTPGARLADGAKSVSDQLGER